MASAAGPASGHPSSGHVRFGVATAPQQVGYRDLLDVWRDADAAPEIDDAWLFDHLLPIAGDPNGPIFEGWTLLSALAVATTRLRLGVLVTSNRFRPPAMLAKIATTVDVVSDGRLIFGIGAGSRPSAPGARREYAAHGLPYAGFTHSVRALDEALGAIRRLWTSAEPFDVEGDTLRLVGAIGNPRPVQRPHPPIVVGGRSDALLRVVARHADQWNVPGGVGDGELDDAIERNAALDRVCTDAGRDPASIVRSVYLGIDQQRDSAHPAGVRGAIGRARDAGFGHVVLGLPAPYRPGVVRWLVDAVVGPSL